MVRQGAGRLVPSRRRKPVTTKVVVEEDGRPAGLVAVGVVFVFVFVFVRTTTTSAPTKISARRKEDINDNEPPSF